MSKMKTLVIAKDGSLSIQEVNKPRYNEYQALVKTIACAAPMLSSATALSRASLSPFIPSCWAMKALARL